VSRPDSFNGGVGIPVHAQQSVAGLAHSYDANGNLLAGRGVSIGYDIENRPVLVNGLATSYDGDGIRWKQGNAAFLSKLFKFYRFPDVRGSLDTNYYFFNGMRIARDLVTAAGLVFYHGDPLNSATTMTDEAGLVINRQVLSPFGRVLAGSIGPIGLAGQRLDESGLHHMGAREMNPAPGLFVTPDAERPQSLNRYAYADNSPANLADTTGLEAEEPVDEMTECQNYSSSLGHKYARVGNALSDGADVVDKEAMEVVRQAPQVIVEAALWEPALARLAKWVHRVLMRGGMSETLPASGQTMHQRGCSEPKFHLRTDLDISWWVCRGRCRVETRPAFRTRGGGVFLRWRGVDMRQALAMSDYRRVWVPGGTYFFTVNLLERRRRLLVEQVTCLRTSLHAAHKLRPFDLLAVVVLPDLLHCNWRLPKGDADNATRWRHIKSGFSRQLPPVERRSAVRTAKGERGIWQRRYWEYLIQDEDDLQRHIDCVHFNPVRHGHVARVRDWPYSSFHRAVNRGSYRQDWAGPG